MKLLLCIVLLGLVAADVRDGRDCTEDGYVDYQGYEITDDILRDKLEELADYFCTRLWLSSGGESASFWVDGYDGIDDGEPLFCDIKNSGLVDFDYQAIWHGLYTCTGGEHQNLYRYGDGLESCFMIEGSQADSSDYCQYLCGVGVNC